MLRQLYRLRALVAVACGLASTPVLASEGKLAIHPMAVVDAVDPDAAAFRRVFAEEVARQKLDARRA
jgi:hypothetical protein